VKNAAPGSLLRSRATIQSNILREEEEENDESVISSTKILKSMTPVCAGCD